MKRKSPPLDRPLSEKERSRLEDWLAALPSEEALSFEQLDGFLCALVVGSEAIPPGEYLPIIWGGGASDGEAFGSEEQFAEILSLVQRLQNEIVAALGRDGLYMPLFDEEVESPSTGKPWAEGFMRAVKLRRESWHPVMDEESEAGSLFAIALLAGEVDPDWHPETLEQQEKLLLHAVVGAARIHRYFRKGRALAGRAARTQAVRRESTKSGRNSPCPCGSGRKFKQCCGAARQLH